MTDMKKRIRRIPADRWLVLLFVAVLLYRIVVITEYCSKWIDEDQALLWYGTALAGHWGIAEPHFLGQAYGSMLESVTAAPMHWIGIPLNYCLPIATAVLWYIPFGISALSLRKKNLLCASLILANPLFYRWDYDILTNIPRSFICGFVFAFIGIAFLCGNREKNRLKALSAPVLMALAYVNTETTITVTGLGVLFAVLYRMKTIRACWHELIDGIVIALIICRFCNDIFYRMNPDYLLHGGYHSITFSADVLKQNLAELGALLRAFSVISIRGMPIALIMTAACILAVPFFIKEWRLLFLDVCGLGGSALFLALPKTRDYYDNLLFSQTRMFLFIAYVIIVLIYFTGHIIYEKECYINICKTHIPYYGVILLGIALAAGKALYFKTAMLEREDLYSSAVLSVSDVNSMYAAASTISNCASDSNCSIVVLVTDNRVLGYATGAINYEQYVSYNAFYDRRTDTYLELKETILDENVLFVETTGNAVSNMYVEHISGNLIDWIRQNLGIQRH